MKKKFKQLFTWVTQDWVELNVTVELHVCLQGAMEKKIKTRRIKR